MTDELRLTPNVEALVSAFLRDQPELVDLLDDRCYTVIPKNAEYPLARVTVLLDQPAGGEPLWLVAATVQIEAFGGTKAQAHEIANTARAAISQRLTGVHAEGVVTGVSSGALLDLPDDEFEPAKQRWLFTSTIYAHAASTLPS